jgi:flagellum-specific peptidoglycan hydrolase FlgJ
MIQKDSVAKGITMKKLTRYSSITLLCVGLLTSQLIFSPNLLAQENQQQDILLSELATTTDEPSSGGQEDPLMLENSSQENFEVMPEENQDKGNLYEEINDSIEAEADQKPTIPVDIIESENGGENTVEAEADEFQTEDEENENIVEEEVESEPETIPEEDTVEVESDPILNDSTENRPDSTEKVQPDENIVVEEIAPPSTFTPEQKPVTQIPKPSPSLTDSLYSDSMITGLPDGFRSSEVASSSLLGFTLPLLSTFEEKWQAAFIYAIIQQIGDPINKDDFEQWHNHLAINIIGEKITWETFHEVEEEKLQPGDLILSHSSETENSTGIYLRDGYHARFVSIDKEDQENEDYPRQQTVEMHRLSSLGNYTVKRPLNSELTEYGEELIDNYPAPFDFSANTTTQEFIDSFAQDAQILGQDYDIFASVLIAQAILESGSGSSVLSSAPHHNLFGIKGSHTGKSIVLPTMEDNGRGELFEIQAAFRSYGSYRDSMVDYVKLIRGGITGNTDFYQEVWRSKAKNYLRATDSLTGTYATDTEYSKKLNSLIAVYELTKYDEVIGTEAGVFIQEADKIPAEYRFLMTFPVYNGRDYNHSGSYPVGQCTWYVFNRVSQLGGRVDDYMGNGGDWGATGRRLGYKVSQTPAAGSVISFAHGTAGSDPRYGHVAFVEAVGPNGILISEGNVYGGTTISYRVISNELALSTHVSYILPK